MSILEEAIEIVKQRRTVYGSARKNHEQIAALWSVILGMDVTAEQVVLCMIGTKIARLIETKDHADSIVDIAGYAQCYEDLL